VAIPFKLPLSARLLLARVTNWAFLSVNGLRYVFNSVIPFSLSLKDLVFSVSARSAMADRQALWQVLVLAMACAT
ncbi:MAG: hypothetical protein ACOYO1_17830, partial [Bacteroidales bacterium]